MLRLVDMDNTCSTQRHATALRQLEKLAYMCLVPSGHAPLKRMADKIAMVSEHNTESFKDES